MSEKAASAFAVNTAVIADTVRRWGDDFINNTESIVFKHFDYFHVKHITDCCIGHKNGNFIYMAHAASLGGIAGYFGFVYFVFN